MKLNSISKFAKENEVLNKEKQSQIKGGSDSLSHRDRSTMDEWNCSDTQRQMMWDGTPCSEWFTIYQEE